MKSLLVIFPTSWDRKQLEACSASVRERYAVRFATPTDEDCPADFDILEFIDRSIQHARHHSLPEPMDGVLSSSDYPGALVAAAIATGCGLPGARPEAVLRCSHKYASRLVQRQAASEAVPPFALVDPENPREKLAWVGQSTFGHDDAVEDPKHAEAKPSKSGFPCFIKPVKGAFSVLSQRIASQAELEVFLDRDCVREFTTDYLGLFHRLQERFAPGLPSARQFIAEGLLTGEQVTIEGFSYRGKVSILGIVDSIMHPGTRSFARFEYPSQLPATVQKRMTDIAKRVIEHIGLDMTLFNIEMTYDPATKRIGIIEINPRMCGQFADLYEKVDGTNGYEVALALAAGERPRLLRGQGAYRAAASFPLRVFEPVQVRHAPTGEAMQAAEALFPHTLVWVECENRQKFCDFDALEDGCSARYAVINVGARDRDMLQERCDAVRSRLGFAFTKLPVTVRDSVAR